MVDLKPERSCVHFALRRKSDALLDWLGPCIVALTGFVLSCVAFWPGMMSPDSVTQLAQARSLALRDDHPPLMALIWALTDLVVSGPSGMLILLNAMYWSGLLLVFRHWPLSRTGRVCAFVVVGAFPPIAWILGVVWKDVLMQSALVVLLGAYLRYRATHRSRWIWVGILSSVVAIGARHNAVAAALPFHVLFVSEYLRARGVKLRGSRLTSVAVALVLTFSLQIGLNKSFKPFVEAHNFWQTALIFDLAGMSVIEKKVLFDKESGVLKENMGWRNLRDVYDARDHNRLYWCPRRLWPCQSPAPCQRTQNAAELDALKRNWLREVAARPEAYWRHRVQVYAELIGFSSHPVRPFRDGFWGEAGRETKTPRARRIFAKYMGLLGQSPLFVPWVYLVLCWFSIGAGMWGAWTGRSALALSLATSGILYSLSYFVLTGSPDYRYSVWTILCGLLSLFALPAAWPSTASGAEAED